MSFFYQCLSIPNWAIIQKDLLDFFVSQKITIPTTSTLFYIDDKKKTPYFDRFRHVQSLTNLLVTLGWAGNWTCTAIVVTFDDGLCPHIDSGDDKFSLVLPLKNTDKTYTVFYESDTTPSKTQIPGSHLTYFPFQNSDVQEIARVEMNQPTLINIKVPHAIDVRSPSLPRLVVSLRIRNI